jgi:putative colanic acid biosynthesis acetyltransferase WcaF
MPGQRLGAYNNSWFDRGRPIWIEAIWMLVSMFVASSIPGSAPRTWLLKLFGASIGAGVVLKPRIRVKFPWRLSIDQNSWIGEDVWLDNLAQVDIGSDCCLSQGVYVCTGNHDWSSETFDLVTEPVSIKDGSWVGAFARIAPGITLGENAVVAMGGVIVGDVPANTVFGGNPATLIKARN